MIIGAVSVQMKEDKCRSIGRENVDNVPRRRMSTADPMDPTPCFSEERPTKKLPTQRFGCGISEAATVS